MAQSLNSRTGYNIGGRTFTKEQIIQALDACRLLTQAYADGQESGSVEWSDLDDAWATATLATGDEIGIANLVLNGAHPTIAFNDVMAYFNLDESFVWTAKTLAKYVTDFAKAQKNA